MLLDPTLLERIKSRIQINERTGCWEWIGELNRNGYGRVWIKGKRLMVHQVTFEHFSGPIEDGLVLDHLCRIRKCCNPVHLDPVTVQENTHRGNAVLFQRIAA